MAARIENSAGSGMPDVLMTYAGKTVLIELKTKKKISKKQIDWARRWAAAGGESWFLIQDGPLLYLMPGNAPPVIDKKWIVKNCREAIGRIYACQEKSRV